jgi:hypothetical protein
MPCQVVEKNKRKNRITDRKKKAPLSIDYPAATMEVASRRFFCYPAGAALAAICGMAIIDSYF